MDAIKSSGLHVWCSSYLLVKEISWESWWLCIIQGFPFCLVNLAFNWVNRYYEIYLALCFSPHSLKLISRTYFRYCYLFVFWIFPPLILPSWIYWSLRVRFLKSKHVTCSLDFYYFALPFVLDFFFFFIHLLP